MSSLPPLTAATADVRRHERLVLLLLAAAQFINIVDFMIIMPLGPRLMRTLDISPAQFALIVSSYTFAAAVAGLLAALCIDRFDRRTALLFVLTGFSLGTVGCALAPDYPLLLVARAATGAFGGVLGGLALTIVGDVFPDERRGAATGVLISAFALASVAGVPLGLVVGGWLSDWHAPFWLLGAAGLSVLALASWRLPHLREHMTRRQASPLAEIYATVARRMHLQAFAVLALVVLGAFMVVPYLSAYFVANLGIQERSLPWIYVVGGALTLLTSPAIGKLADRMGRQLLFCSLASASGVMMLTMTVLPPMPLALVALLTALLMAANSGRMIVAMTMINACVDPRRRGSFMSLSSSVQHLASGCGAFASGQILGLGAERELTHYGIVGALAACTALGSIVLMSGLRPTSTVAEPAEPSAEEDLGLALCADSQSVATGRQSAA